jgi:hypothetical protein
MKDILKTKSMIKSKVTYKVSEIFTMKEVNQKNMTGM